MSDTTAIDIKSLLTKCKPIFISVCDKYYKNETLEFRNNAKQKVKDNIDINNSRFKEHYIKSLNANKSDVPFTLNGDAVANIVYNIATSSKPKPRYYITKATYLLGYLKRILPTTLLDKILIKI